MRLFRIRIGIVQPISCLTHCLDHVLSIYYIALEPIAVRFVCIAEAVVATLACLCSSFISQYG